MAKQTKQTKSLALTKDQFTFNDKGELVIKSAEVKQMLEAPLAESTPDEQGKVSGSVTVGVSFTN